jgi:hypothetical protein
LPSGSGIDNGTKVADISDSALLLSCGFHHMNDGGMYDGWTEHTIRVKPDWRGIKLTVTGRNRNEVKDYLGELYYDALTALVVCDGETDLYRFVEDAFRPQPTVPPAGMDSCISTRQWSLDEAGTTWSTSEQIAEFRVAAESPEHAGKLIHTILRCRRSTYVASFTDGDGRVWDIRMLAGDTRVQNCPSTAIVVHSLGSVFQDG